MNKNAIGWLFVGGVPLIIYPGVLLANLMSLAGHRSGQESLALVLVVYLFLWSTTIYPIIYFACLYFASKKFAAEDNDAGSYFSRLPVFYLVGVVAIGFLWAVIGS